MRNSEFRVAGKYVNIFTLTTESLKAPFLFAVIYANASNK